MSVLEEPDALVMPAFWHCPTYVETIGPEVADLAKLFGRTPNPEQQLLLDGSFGMDKRGRMTAFEVFVLASRQNLKTGFFEFRALGKALLLKRPVQIWTAHKESATDQALSDFLEMIENSAELSKRIRSVGQGKGSKDIVFTNGCRIVFRPRTGKAGQSMSADDVDLDEYFAVEPAHLGSLIPTLSTRPHAQVGGASSAPHRGSNSQRALMARGRAAVLDPSLEPRLLYAEWSVQRLVGKTLDGRPKYGPPPCQHSGCTHEMGSEGCIADDRELIKLANPSAGRSSAPAISWDYLADERRTLSSDADAIAEYFKERLGAGDEGDEATAMTIFGPASVWQQGSADQVEKPATPAAIGVAVAVDRAWSSIAAGALVEVLEDPEDEESEPLERSYVAPVDRREGVGWLVAEVKRIQDETDCMVVIDGNGPAKDLVEDLENADVALELIDLDDIVKATARFFDKVKAGKLLHPVSVELDTAVGVAEWRYVGDGARAVGRRQSTDDVSMLEAAICADHGASLSSAVTVG